MSLLRYPYTNLHELNLDWIIEQLGKEGNVLSVNGKSGIVTLTGEDINRSTNNPETVATALDTQGQSIQTVRTQIGVTPLPTVAQTLTGAIAENAQEIADVEDNVIGSTELPTEAQTLTGAIAENADNIGGNAESITNINTKIGTTALPTTAQTLTGAINELNSTITTINITSVRRIAATVTTGATGNIALPYFNDGYNYIIAPIASGASVALRTWVSSINSNWYLTAINPNTGETLNNTELAIRYLILSIRNINA